LFTKHYAKRCGWRTSFSAAMPMASCIPVPPRMILLIPAYSNISNNIWLCVNLWFRQGVSVVTLCWHENERFYVVLKISSLCLVCLWIQIFVIYVLALYVVAESASSYQESFQASRYISYLYHHTYTYRINSKAFDMWSCASFTYVVWQQS